MSPDLSSGARSRARVVLITGLAMLLGGAVAILPSAAWASTQAAPTVAQMTQRVVDDTNAVRAERGLPGLVRNADLDKVAADWARQQWQNGAMSHNPHYSKQIPAGWQRAGENVGKGYTYTQIVAAWKGSSSHYANLVNDYTSVGVGYFEQDGKRYWSQVFAKYTGVKQPAQSAPPASTAPSGSAPSGTGPAGSTPASGSGSTASPAAEPAAPAGATVALSSPSFEGGLGAWTAPSGTVDGPNSSARGGSRSLLVPGASGRVVSQSVTTNVAAGSTHSVVVWVRADASARGTLTLRTVGGGATEKATISFTASASGWLRVVTSLEAKRAHTGFTIEVATSTSGRTYRLDSVSLTRTGEPAAPAPSSTSAPAPATSPSPAPSATPAPTPSPTPTTPAPAPTPTPTPTPSPTPAPQRPVLDLGRLLFGNRG